MLLNVFEIVFYLNVTCLVVETSSSWVNCIANTITFLLERNAYDKICFDAWHQKRCHVWQRHNSDLQFNRIVRTCQIWYRCQLVVVHRPIRSSNQKNTKELLWALINTQMFLLCVCLVMLTSSVILYFSNSFHLFSIVTCIVFSSRNRICVIWNKIDALQRVTVFFYAMLKNLSLFAPI